MNFPLSFEVDELIEHRIEMEMVLIVIFAMTQIFYS